MELYEEILEIYKEGIEPFVKVTVKSQHKKLLDSISNTSKSEFKGKKSCSLCNKRNLVPRHSSFNCPSRNMCLCKTKRKQKRPCPKGICDYMYEEIIEDHCDYSPNLKTTDISKWIENDWEIAMCYMEHHSQSAECTDIIDMLHLVANNRFILHKLLHIDSATPTKEEEEADKNQKQLIDVRDIIDKNIKVCTRLKQSTGKCNEEDIQHMEKLLDLIADEHTVLAKSKYEEIKRKISSFDKTDQKSLSDEQIILSDNGDAFNQKIKKAISVYILGADKALRCKRNGNELTTLQIFTEQMVEKSENDHTNSLIKKIFEEKMPRRYIVTKAVNDDESVDYSSRWDEYEWLIYNSLKHFLHSGKKGETEDIHSLDDKPAVTYSNIYVVSKTFSCRVRSPLQSFSEYVRRQVELENQHSLVILDFRDPIVFRVFENGDDIFEKHTVIKIVDEKEFTNMKNEKSSHIFLRLHPVTGLTIKEESEGKMRNKSYAKQIQKCLHKCMIKIGPENISELTFENIRFNDPSTKLKLSFIPKVKTLMIKSCVFTPGLPSSLVSIEVEERERRMSHYLNQLNIIFPTTIQTCHSLRYLESAEIEIGNVEFCIKLNKGMLENSANKYYKKTLIECDKDQALELLHNEISKILNSTKCNYKDFEQADNEDRNSILKGTCYGLRESDENLVHVYAAEHYGKNERKEIVLVCYMRENFDIDKECSWGKYRGFKTFKKSYFYVCPELPDKKSDVINENKLNEYLEKNFRHVNETIREHSTRLIKDHSNLEIIGITLGKNNGSENGPCIALYVRSKSFVPYGEKLFPSELTHPSNKEITFKTVVREDYFVPLADFEPGAFNAFQWVPYLAMGCSIGVEGNSSGASLGPFVEYESGGEKNTGFLTVCHLFSLPENAPNVNYKKVVQPCEDDVFVDMKQPNQETSTSSVCGMAIANVYDEEVDASFILIKDRAPDTDRFINCQKRDLTEAGFSRDRGMPRYKDGSSVDLHKCIDKCVIKFGMKTQLTSGKCLLSESVVRVSDVPITATCPFSGERRRHYMRKQFQIRGLNGKRFCDYGDSGAGIFLVNEDKSLSCVGIVIGQIEGERTCIATPIKTVLDKLSNKFCHRITLKKFPE